MAEGTVERTLVLVKPDGVRRGLVGEILGRLERKQLRIVAAKLTAVATATAESHYAEHKGKPFYPGLVTHITSAPAVQLRVHQLEQTARFFFVEIQIAVPSGAKRTRGDDVVSFVEIARVSLDQVMQKDVIDAASFAGNPHQTNNFPGHCNHAQVG